MKQLVILLLAISSAWSMEQPVALKEPSSLKKQCYLTLFKLLNEKKLTYDGIVQKNVPVDLMDSFKPHKAIKEVIDKKGNKIDLCSIYSKTPDYFYGILQGKEGELYRVELDTGKKEKIMATSFTSYLSNFNLSPNGAYLLYFSHKDGKFVLCDIAKKSERVLDIKKCKEPFFCGDDYILAPSNKLSIYKIVDGTPQKMGKVNVNLVEMNCEIILLNNQECIVSSDGYKLATDYYLMNYVSAKIVKKWQCNHDVLRVYVKTAVYGPERLVAFLFEGDSWRVQISKIDDPVDKQEQLPSLKVINNMATVNSLCFAQNGTWIVTGSDNHDGCIRIWDWQKELQLLVFNPRGLRTSPLNCLFYNNSRLFFKDGYGAIHTIRLLADSQLLKAALECQMNLEYGNASAYLPKDFTSAHIIGDYEDSHMIF